MNGTTDHRGRRACVVVLSVSATWCDGVVAQTISCQQRPWRHRAEYSARLRARHFGGRHGRKRAGAVAGRRAGHAVVADGRIRECAGDLAAATAVATQG